MQKMFMKWIWCKLGKSFYLQLRQVINNIESYNFYKLFYFLEFKPLLFNTIKYFIFNPCHMCFNLTYQKYQMETVLLLNQFQIKFWEIYDFF